MSTKLNVGAEVDAKNALNQRQKRAQEFCLSEHDFPLLEGKPEVDRKCKKVRRHAGAALLQKKLADRAYIVKNIVDDHGVGKKRKARLLSEHADEFQAFVPYSLNRKNRWNTVKLEDCVNSVAPQNLVKVSGVEAYLAINGRNELLATKYVERNEDNTLTTRVTHSVRGTPVQVLSEPPKEQKSRREQKRAQQAEELLEVKENVTPVEETPELHVQFTIAKSHPVTKVLLGKYAKNGRTGGCKTTRRVMTHVINKEYLEDCGEVEVETNDDEENFGRQTRWLTLGDFITQDTSPVIVRTKSIQSIDDEGTSNEADEAKQGGGVVHAPKISKESIFVTEKFRSAQIGIHDWAVDCLELEKRNELRFRWVNPAKTRFIVDLTSLITESPSPSKMELVLFFEKLANSPKHTRVLFNGAFKSHVNIDFLKREISCYNAETLNGFIDVVVKRLKKHYIKSESPSEAAMDPMRAAFNSRELAVKAEPWSERRIIDADNSKPSMEDTFMITDDFFESIAPHNEMDAESDDLDDFEQIDMDELLSEPEMKVSASLNVTEIELVPDLGSGCDICDEMNEDEVQMLENCGHKFCSNCLRTYLTNQIYTKCLPLTCFHDTCQGEVPLVFLAAILPLPLVSFYLRFQFVAVRSLVTECPASKEIVVLDAKSDFGQVHCAKCGVYWCLECMKPPHWPLNCEQASEWNEKFIKQHELNEKRENSDEYLLAKRCYCGKTMEFGEKREQVACKDCGRGYYWKTGKGTRQQRIYTPSEFVLEVLSKTRPDNLIATPYSTICSEMRNRRFDTATARQFAKQARKLATTFKFGTPLNEHRKTVLYLLEFGFAWLYMTMRTDRPPIWSSIKANLSTLRGQFDALEKEILGSEAKPVNAEIVTKKMDDTATLAKKIIDELKNYVH